MTVSLSPATAKWIIYQGATFNQQVTLLTGAIGSPPVNLTSYTGATLIVRDEPAGVVLMTLTSTPSASGVVLLGGSGGTVQVTITATTTAAIPWKSAVFDLFITEPDGVTVDCIVRGNLVVTGLIS